MSERQETHAAVIAEMRKPSNEDICPWWADGGSCPQCPMGAAGKNCPFDKFADRLEASYRREMSKIVSKNGADFGQLGNTAAMREALTKVSEWMAHRIATCGFEPSATIPTMLEDVVLPALAAPPRNCDNYNTEADAKSAFLAYWNKNHETDYDIGDLKHNVNGITQDYAEWLMEGATDGK